MLSIKQLMFLCVVVTLFLNKTLLSDSLNYKIISDLQFLVRDSPQFYGCTFTLFDPDEPEHKDYYEALKSQNARSKPLYYKLENDLKYYRLEDFYQFKEWLTVKRQYAILKKDTADYALLYSMNYYAKKYPKDKFFQESNDEKRIKCSNTYQEFLNKLNDIENQIIYGFLKYYSSNSPILDLPKKIYDHGLVQLASGNIEEAIKLAEKFLVELKKTKNTHTLSTEQLAWEKLITLTGNIQEDYQKIALLLEENKILSKANLVPETVEKFGSHIRSDYRMQINGELVQAVFETNTITNETYLKNAWVVTR